MKHDKDGEEEHGGVKPPTTSLTLSFYESWGAGPFLCAAITRETGAP